MAIKSLPRHKAAGTDEIPNDYHKDWAYYLDDPLAELNNQLLQGITPPHSFTQDRAIPCEQKVIQLTH